MDSGQVGRNVGQTNKAIAIKTPRERAVVMLIEWRLEDGAKVEENQTICKLEIAWVYETPLRQEVIEISSPANGSLYQLAKIGDVLGAGQRIAEVIPSQGAVTQSR